MSAKLKIKRKSNHQAKLKKKSGLVVTLILYGPTDRLATKLVASAVHQSAGVQDMKKWFSDGETDVRKLQAATLELAEFITKWDPDTVISPDRIFGCPHEEGIDYPEGESCPLCPFWAGRSRFTGQLFQ
jgi:hypothetical protein